MNDFEIIEIAESLKRASHRVRNSGDVTLADMGLKFAKKAKKQITSRQAKEVETEYLWILKDRYFPFLPNDKRINTISMSGYDDPANDDNTVPPDDTNDVEIHDTNATQVTENRPGEYVTIVENLNNEQTIETANSSEVSFDLDSAIKELNDNAMPLNQYEGHCAANIREALEAGGIDTTGHPIDAKDYGDFLENRGFKAADESAINEPQKGDIVVIQPNEDGSHSHGHIAMYDGEKWVSDAEQRNYSAGLTGDYTVYRNGK